MNLQFALDSYRDAGPASEVESASRFRLIQILMEHALQSLSTAASADAGQDQEQVVARRTAIGKAIDAIETLRQSLHQAPADDTLTQPLHALYGHMIDELIRTVTETDSARVNHVSKLLAELKSAWDELPDMVGKEPALKAYFS